MGLKLRLGLAGLGLALSSMFGVNMLSGVKDYVDTTGNIMVDIADGIGMVSKVTHFVITTKNRREAVYASVHNIFLIRMD